MNLATKKAYTTLLRSDRMRSTRVPDRTLEEEADADRGRILFCAPFRRLQKKAQVFSLEMNAAVRTRLTHSLEVSSIGRLIAQQAIAALDGRSEELGIVGNERALITFVETACLIHDIGNPPFGHFGELVISEWFQQQQHEDDLRPKVGGIAQTLWEQHYKDFLNFDGNPQGFRIVTRLQPDLPDDLHGLNLTTTTLATVVKYPWPSDKINPAEGRKKAGYFRTELDVVDEIWNRLGLAQEARHPLALLLEAADDIAYCISDIEDGIETRHIEAREFAGFMLDRLAGTGLAKEDQTDPMTIFGALHELCNPKNATLTPMKDLRSAVLRDTARAAAVEFGEKQDDILAGKHLSLLKTGDAADVLGALKAFAKRNLYSSPLVRERELTAQAVLNGLLGAYSSLMKCNRDRFKCIIEGQPTDGSDHRIGHEASLYSRISKKSIAVYNASVKASDERNDNAAVRDVMELIHRIHLIVDYICGMTDDFALATYRLISGAAH